MRVLRSPPGYLFVALLFAACSPKGGATNKPNQWGNGGDSNPDASMSGTGSTGGASANGGGGDNGIGAGGEGFLQVHDAAEPPLDAKLSPDSGCEAVKDTRPQAPNVLIVLDRSASMYKPKAVPPVDRWDPAVASIDALTKRLDAQVRFGLLEFPSPLDARAFCGSGQLVVSPDVKQGDAIAAALAGDPKNMVAGATPTAAALSLAKSSLASMAGSSYVLLVTDGAPNCNENLDASTCACTAPDVSSCRGVPFVDGGPASFLPQPIQCLDDTSTVAAVKALADAGVQTFVVGYNATGFEATLNQMAAAGGSARTTFYPVTDGESLVSAFQQISAYVVSCDYELSAAPPDERFVSVSVDDHRVKRGVGWELVGDRTVHLIGDTCKQVSDGSPHDVLVVRECRPILQ